MHLHLYADEPNVQSFGRQGHMGHDVGTHKRHYRLHNNRIELTNVGRLLSSLESGKAPCNTGMGLLQEGKRHCIF